MPIEGNRQFAGDVSESDSRRGSLSRGEYKNIPRFIETQNGTLDLLDATLSQYRQAKQHLRGRIKQYSPVCVKPEELRALKQTLSEMNKLDRHIAPLMCRAEAVKIREGLVAHEELKGRNHRRTIRKVYSFCDDSLKVPPV